MRLAVVQRGIPALVAPLVTAAARMVGVAQPLHTVAPDARLALEPVDATTELRTVLISTKVSSATSKASSAAPSPSATASGSATQCLTGKKVPYKVSSDAAYSQLAQPYNLRLPYKPAVIVLPTTNQHVQDAVVCGAKGGLKIQAKSGGHSYASYSSGGKDGSMGKLTYWKTSRVRH
jgi:hypothetical protein